MHHLADVTTDSTHNRGSVTQYIRRFLLASVMGASATQYNNTFSIGYDCLLRCATFEILVHHRIHFKLIYFINMQLNRK